MMLSRTTKRVTALAAALLITIGGGVAVAGTTTSAAAPTIPCTQTGRTVVCTVNAVTTTKTVTKTAPGTTTTVTSTAPGATVTGPTTTVTGPTTTVTGPTSTVTSTAPPVTSTATTTVTATSTVTAPPTSGQAGALLFEDDFTGPVGTYDHTKWGEWSTATYNSSAAYGNIKPGDRATLDGQGHLSIPATPTQGTSISTKDDFTFTYGTITARVMVQKESGYWPAFWTLNSPPNGTSAALVGEVDPMEAYTQYNDGYRVAAHNYVNGSDAGPHQNPLVGGGDIRGVWHDYSARIEPNRVTILFDGVEAYSFTPSHPDLAGKPWAWGANAKNWLLLTNAVGNSSQGMNPPTVNSVLLVDRVEVRAL